MAKEESKNEVSDIYDAKKLQSIRQLFASEELTSQRMSITEDLIADIFESVVNLVQVTKDQGEKLAMIMGQTDQQPSVMAPISPQDQNQKPNGVMEQLTDQVASLNQMQQQPQGQYKGM